jgi:hypothetical protein
MNDDIKEGLEKIRAGLENKPLQELQKYDEAQTNDYSVEDALRSALRVLRANKPSERTEKARRYAVTITEMEKVNGYFNTYVINALDKPA